MRTFDYRQLASRMWRSDIVSAIGKISEYKGKQNLYLAQRPSVLQKLVDIAMVQSVDASNRIEGIVTTHKRLEQLVMEKTTPRNRNEREIAGYRKVLSTIHESYEDIPLTPGIILQLHRDLFSQVPEANGGKFKVTPNVIRETRSDGSIIERFRPLEPYETAPAIENACRNFNECRSENAIIPLLLIPAFVLDFLCIHPFSDGNGRMSRLLMTLLLYQSGFIVGKYISLEHEIELSKETYYEALMRCNVGWHTNEHDPTPFVDYMLGMLLSAYDKFEERVHLVENSVSALELVESTASHWIGAFSTREIAEALPAISRASVEKSLHKLMDAGKVERLGRGRGTIYRWITS